MTERARWALQDCKGAALELRQNDDVFAWRRRWLTVVTLLRAIGHILKNVDRKQSQDNAHAIDLWWQELSKNKLGNEIFWKFINKERNSILKEYLTEGSFKASITTYHTTNESIGSTSSHFEDGHFKGRSTLEVVEEAIEWWEIQLDAIDAYASK
nr:hypothetical protein [Pseudomonas benzenivorans]